MLARSNYFLSLRRWEEGRVNEAIDLLERIPEKYRAIEWHIARRQYQGGDFTCYDTAFRVDSVAFSPDENWIVPGGSIRIRLWDAETGQN